MDNVPIYEIKPHVNCQDPHRLLVSQASHYGRYVKRLPYSGIYTYTYMS